MSLNERRALADHASMAMALHGARLRHRIDALRDRFEPHRASLTVAAGLAAGALASLLPLRRVVRVGMLGMDGVLLFARLLPRRTRNPTAHATGAADVPGSMRGE